MDYNMDYNIGKLIHEASIISGKSEDDIIRKITTDTSFVDYLKECCKIYNHGGGEVSKKYIKPEGLDEKIRGILQKWIPLQKNTIKIAHIADIHISEKITSAGKVIINPETGRNRRLDDIERCLNYAVNEAIKQKCDIALITEPFDRPSPTPGEIDVFMNAVLRLARVMPVVVEPGNHGLDRNRTSASAFSFLKGQQNIYYIETPQTLYYDGMKLSKEPSTETVATIHVLPYPVKYPKEEMKVHLDNFRKKGTSSVSVLLAHVTVEGAEGADYTKFLSSEPVLSVSDLQGFDYVALGHIHRFQRLDDRIFYAGDIERLDFNEEGQKKGFIIADIDRATKSLSLKFIETPATTLKTISIDEVDSITPDNSTIYRVVGTVDKQARNALLGKVSQYQDKVPLMLKIQINDGQKIKEASINDTMTEEQAITEYLKQAGLSHSVDRVIETHRMIRNMAS